MTALRDGGSAALLHALFALVFITLLQWRPSDASTETAIPVEIVVQPFHGGGGNAMSSAPAGPAQDARAGTPSTASDTAGHPSAPLSREPPQPAFVAPPPDPMRAATQTERKAPANDLPTPQLVEAPKPATQPDTPKVLRTEAASASVPPKVDPKPDASPQAPAPAADKPDQTAKLAAALPMDMNPMPTSFRAVLSGAGTVDNENFKGLVYGRLGRSPEIIQRARARGLRGQVVVGFSIGDDGSLKSLAVSRSSGNREVDELALEMVRAAAPFPPPPPGAQRSFTPGLAFGD